MKNQNRGKYGGFTDKTPRERKEHTQEQLDNQKNGPVLKYYELTPTVIEWILQQIYQQNYEPEQQDHAA